MKNKLLLNFLLIFTALGLFGCKKSTSHEGTLAISGNEVGNLALNTPKVAHILVKNLSEKSVNRLRVQGLIYPFAFEGGSFPGKSGDCDETLHAGNACNVAIEIAPQSMTGVVTQSAEFLYEIDGVAQAQSFTMRGEVIDIATLFTSNVDFGVVKVGDKAKQKLILRNASTRETITNLSLHPTLNSHFIIKNPSQCAVIQPNTSCELNVKFSPTGSAFLSEDLAISYEIGGKTRSQTILLNAKAEDLDGLEITGHDFGDAIVNLNARGEVNITVTKNTNSNIINNLHLEGLGTEFKVSGMSSCKTMSLFSAFDGCTFVLVSRAKIVDNTPVNQSLTLKYQLNGVDKTAPFTLKGKFQIKDLDINGQDFKSVVMPINGSAPIKIVVSNPHSSSILMAKNFSVSGYSGSSINLDLDQNKSTCLKNTSFYQGDTCNLIFNAKVLATEDNFTRNLKLSYTSFGISRHLEFTIKGDLKVSATMSSQYVTLAGYNFGNINFNQGSSFNVPLTVKNTSFTESARALRIDRENIFWDPTYFVQLDTGASTCNSATILAPNKSCVFSLRFSPNKNDNNFSRPFLIEYSDTSNTTHTIQFDLAGSFTITLPPSLPQSGGPPKTTLNCKDPTCYWYNYIKRAVKTNPLDTSIYPMSIWNRVVDHVPWTFSSAKPNALAKLSDMVIDRRTDPVTNKEYLVMYHGTTSDLLTTFQGGANNIDFSKGGGALDTGFYLAASPNESKNYACTRAASKHDSKIHGLLLVVGVEVNDQIQGRESPGPLSDNKGNPLDPSIFFRRNDSSFANQIVTFSNIKKYLKIFEVVELGKNFGMADDMAEINVFSGANGLGMNNTAPDTSTAYRCLN